MIIVSYTPFAEPVAIKAQQALILAGHDAEAFHNPNLSHAIAVTSTSTSDDYDGAVAIVQQLVARFNREGNNR